MNRIAIGLLAGLLFGTGLAVSGMTDPDKVLNFLDVTGRWDPSLALVMGSALLVSLPGFAWARRHRTTLIGKEALPPPPATTLDARLLLGSALFGVGWAIAGYCPGPALANLGHAREVLLFVPAMLAGSLLARRLQRR